MTISISTPSILTTDPAPITAQQSVKVIDHHPALPARWWLGMFSASGRKAENQDSVLVTTCLLDEPEAAEGDTETFQSQPSLSHQQLPLLVLLADGVSACQFPKQASQLAVDTVAQEITQGLATILQAMLQAASLESDLDASLESCLDEHKTVKQRPSQFSQSAALFDEEEVASLIKLAVSSANDALYFSQAYQRVPPLLTTLSGLLCIGDRIHLFHTGDSRIYRVGADSLTVLSHDHRIHHGQDKGALSAALGADTEVDLQQSIFTLHQNECLALMTDGVYEHIDAAEMQFELCSAATRIFNPPVIRPSLIKNSLVEKSLIDNSLVEKSLIEKWGKQKGLIHSTFTEATLSETNLSKQVENPLIHETQIAQQISHQLCDYAYKEGSNDNLSMVILGMTAFEPFQGNEDSAAPLNRDGYLLELGDEAVKPNDHTLKKQSANPPKKVAKFSRYQLPTGLKAGDYIDGFTVVDIIARTARSEVYLVHDAHKREFVLKSPSVSSVDDGNYLRDFLKERKIGLSLSKHRRSEEAAYNQADPNRADSSQPGLTKAHVRAQQGIGSGLSESGLLRYYPVPASSPYLYHLTEYIDGESLRVFIDRHAPCDVWQTHDLLTKIGMAVRVMHRNYLLHQDIKPENILLTKSGAVKLIDFGSASSAILKDSTRPPGGDLHYAAPEYYSDAPKGVHSDLFSIAVIGFELLTGERPFRAQTLMTPRQKLVVPAHLLRQQQVPAASQQALLRALHSNPNARYPAIGEFLQDFNPDNSAALLVREPLIKRNPLLVWHGICCIQGIIIIILLIKLLPLS